MLARSVLWQNATLVWRIFFIRLVMFCFTALLDDIVILSEMCQWRTVLQNVQQLSSSKAIQACVQSSGTFPPLMHVYLLLLLAPPPSCPLVALVSLLAEWGGFGRVGWGGELQGKHTLSNPSLRARSDGPGGHEKPCGRTWLPDQWWQEERRFFPPHVKWCSMFQEWGAGRGINVRASGWRREKGTTRLWNI